MSFYIDWSEFRRLWKDFIHSESLAMFLFFLGFATAVAAALGLVILFCYLPYFIGWWAAFVEPTFIVVIIFLVFVGLSVRKKRVLSHDTD